MDKPFPNDKYSCLLFDENFREKMKPAEYFWSEFLGFSIGSNNLILSKQFYEKVYAFVKQNYSEIEKQNQVLNGLDSYFVDVQGNNVDANEFKELYIEDELCDAFVREVGNEFPRAFKKDIELLKAQVTKKKIHFSSDINISGPFEAVRQSVHIVKDSEELQKLTLDGRYTILLIDGKPKIK